MRKQEDRMRKEYDIDGLDPRPNPYAKELKQQITIRLDTPVIEYFKGLSADCGIPYQTLINMCLADYVKNKRTPKISWQ
jgi:uncharacterized protein (DUF4415 family)